MTDQIASNDTPPAPTPTTGPIEHLDTVEYWRDLYRDAVAEGQRQIDLRNRFRSALERIAGFDPVDDNGLACWNRWPSQPDRWCPTCIATEALK